MLNPKQANVDWIEPSLGVRWRAGLGQTQAALHQARCFSAVEIAGFSAFPGCTGCKMWLQLSSPQSKIQVFRCKQIAAVTPLVCKRLSWGRLLNLAGVRSLLITPQMLGGTSGSEATMDDIQC